MYAQHHKTQNHRARTANCLVKNTSAECTTVFKRSCYISTESVRLFDSIPWCLVSLGIAYAEIPKWSTYSRFLLLIQKMPRFGFRMCCSPSKQHSADPARLFIFFDLFEGCSAAGFIPVARFVGWIKSVGTNSLVPARV